MQLPPAARRPPHPCVNSYISDRLGPGGVLVPDAVDFLSERQAWLEQRAEAYIKTAGAQWPEDHASIRTFITMVKQTCSPRPSKYSLSNLVALLYRQRSKPGGAEVLRARDYYSKAHAAKYFQLNLVLGLIDNMDALGFQLPAAPRAKADCVVCFAMVEDRARWCHLEPCRHFLCADCTNELLRACGGGTCPLCRADVVEYVHVKRPARLSCAQ